MSASTTTTLAPAETLSRRVDELLELIEKNDSFLVVSHVDPDGDAVGSTLAMALLLKRLGRDVVAFNRDEIPYNFRFLPGAELWQTELEPSRNVDVTILLDCGDPSRIGEEFPRNGWGDSVVVIDHHKTLDLDFADLYIHDIEAAAAGELVYRVVQRFDLLDTEIAQNIYCCMMTDTGSFRYSNTSKPAFQIAGELVEAGVDPWHMTSHVYENQPVERLDLLCLVLGTLRRSECGRLAFIRIEERMLEETGATSEMTDGMINYARSIRGVEVATQLEEKGGDCWGISFRSRGNVDVSELAGRFGGGGHQNAAGCEMCGDPEEVEARLTEALSDLLDG